MKTFVLNGWAASERAWDLCLFPKDRIFSYIEQLDGRPEDVLSREDGAVLVGWSMGGSTALRLALDHPEKIKGLVLIAATARMMKDKNWMGMSPARLSALKYGLRMTLKGEGFFQPQPGMPNPYENDSEENLERGLRHLEETDLRLRLIDLMASGRVKCPVHIFQSERDGIVRPENARFLATVFPGATVEMVPGAEHALPVTIPGMIDSAVASILLGAE